MPTTTMNISLSQALKDFVHERVAEKAYSNPSDYVRALIREDQERRAEERLGRLLLDGIESGPPEEVTPEDREAIRREVRERIARGRQRRGA